MTFDPWFRNRLIRDGILAAIHERMQQDPSIYILGEGAHMKVHFDSPSIERDFPDRVITLPISEDSNTNFAVGLSLAGLTPIVDVITSDFLFRTMDAICNTAAKQATVSEPRCVVIRAEFITGGPTTGQRIESLFAHIPGLRVVVPSNLRDAKILMLEALQHKGVTIFFEDRTIPDSAQTDAGPHTLDINCIYPLDPQRPVPAARVTNFILPYPPKTTVVAYGLTASQLQKPRALLCSGCNGDGGRHPRANPSEAEAADPRPFGPCPGCYGGWDSTYELIDLRYLYPLDIETILESARRTKRLLVVEPDSTFMGIGAEIIAQVAEEVPGCKVKRLGAPRMTIPACRDLHSKLLCTSDEIIAAIGSLR